MKFVSKDLALKLKEKGFDKPCFGYYFIEDKNENDLHKNITCGGDVKNCLRKLSDEKHIDAPTTDQVLEWLRDDKNVHIGIMPYSTMSTKNNILWLWEVLLVGKIIECKNTLYVDKDYNYTKLASADYCASYDDAYVDVIEYVIDNCI